MMQLHSVIGFIGLIFVVMFVLGILYFLLFFLPAAIKEKNKYNDYPELKEFEQLIQNLLFKIERESSWYFLKPIIFEIDNIPAKYKGKVPDHVLRSALTELRSKYQDKRNYLAPKAT